MHIFEGLQADCAICLPSESFCQSRYGFAKQLGPWRRFISHRTNRRFYLQRLQSQRSQSLLCPWAMYGFAMIHTRRWCEARIHKKGVPTHTAVPLSAGKGSTLYARVEQCEMGDCVSRVMEIHIHISDIGVFHPCSQPAPSPVFDLWCHRVVGGLKRPQNFVRGRYVGWFDFIAI